MFNIKMLPAGYGDCLWIEYGDKADPNRVLIDGGIVSTYKAISDRIKGPPERKRFELFIITHVDADHIEGAVKLMNNAGVLGVAFDDVWFNGYKQIEKAPTSILGPAQGEYLSALIEKNRHPLNQPFGKDSKGVANPVMVPNSGPLPRHVLPGGMKLTLLSPTIERLTRLRPAWDEAVIEAGIPAGNAAAALEKLEEEKKFRRDALGPRRVNVDRLARTPFASDTTAPNGSSIAVLAEYEGKRSLLTGDAFATVLLQSIKRLLKEEGLRTLKLDAFKLPHHGSSANISTDLLDLVQCERYLFSTNGARYGHPDDEAVARVIKHGGKSPLLFFNYLSEQNKIWATEKMLRDEKYRVRYPKNDEGGILIEL